MPVSVLKDIRKIYAGLNADEIRGSAHQDLNVGLVASNEETLPHGTLSRADRHGEL